jgi:hypothetical protein
MMDNDKYQFHQDPSDTDWTAIRMMREALREFCAAPVEIGVRRGQLMNDLETKIDKLIMSLETFGAAMNNFFDVQGTAIDGLAADVKNLNDQIKVLQNSPGAITAADQTTLDAIQARASAMADKLSALDALTPPVVPQPAASLPINPTPA